MFTRIIDILDSQVKPSIPADATTAVDDDGRYAGIPCSEDDPRTWCWCPGCQEQAQRRDDAVMQLALPPIPAEAACGDASDYDFPPTRAGWTPEHDRVMARLWNAERGGRS